MISKEVELIMEISNREAVRLRHEYVGLEHLLFAICHCDTGKLILSSCGADVDQISRELNEFLEKEINPLSGEVNVIPAYTEAFREVMDRALMHSENSDQELVEVGDIVISMMDEKESFAIYTIRKQGISKIDMMEFVSHGLQPVKKTTVETKKQKKDQQNSPKHLETFTVLLNEKAKQGKINPLIGRKDELERIIHILNRRQKNNPILVGDTGVGKTAIVEGFASRIVLGQVPEAMRNTEIFSMDMGSLLAGTRYRGDFEERFKLVMNEIQKRPQAVIFIDEIHTVIGAGAVSGGTMDASNLLKPLLSSSDLRCIGSTTYDEYKQHVEKDPALSRRFQKIEVGEPSRDKAIQILGGVKSKFEDFHHLKYSDQALRAAVDLSIRYLPDRRLPDKAIDIIDESGATLKLRHHQSSEKAPVLTTREIQNTISRMSKIPVKAINNNEKDDLKTLADKLKKKIFGQDKAVETIAVCVHRNKAGLGDIHQPIGSFLFYGPTGVGKTELAKQLASEVNMEFIRFDMSEYMEKHSVSRLIGAPPGYVGFEQGGLLTDTVTRYPHSLILLDEIEKAHPDIYNVLLQVMDHGILTDHNGRRVDFTHSLLVLTSNVGSMEMDAGAIGFGVADSTGKGKRALKDLFRPEFLNRLDEVVEFGFLPDRVVDAIVKKFIDELNDKLKSKKIVVHADGKAIRYLREQGFNRNQGARFIKRLVDKEITNRLTREILFGALAKGGKVIVSAEKDRLNLKFRH